MRDLRPMLIPLLLLAGCATAAPPPPPLPPPGDGPASLGGVSLDQPLRALGTEPFWSVEIRSDALVLSGPDRPEIRTARPRRTMNPGSAVITAPAPSGDQMRVTLTAQSCSDGMSDRTYPLTARVEFGAERLSGCAASVSAIMNAGESGPVVD